MRNAELGVRSSECGKEKGLSLTKQLNLLDLKPEKGPSPKMEMDWNVLGRQRFEAEEAAFFDLYGEKPVFWKTIKHRCDLFQVRPWNQLVVDRESGLLRDSEEFLPFIWDPGVWNFSPQRQSHLSPQILAFLRGEIGSEQWISQVMQDIKYVPERRAVIFELLQVHEVHFYVDMGPYRGIIRIFASPETVRAMYLQGASKGVFL